MITEFLIFGLLLISFTINLLALGAFWVTPGLRTTANRFVINLLVVNLFGCIVLAPTLFLNHSNLIEEDIVKVQIKNHLDNNNNNINNSDYKNNNSEQITETLLKCNSSRCEKITIENDRSTNSESIVITEIDIINNNNNNNNNDPEIDDFITDDDNKENTDVNQQQQHHQQQQQQQQETSRWWSLDLAAALGALSVLLVVGDTWCAVTDPLRYHSRISGLKSWILIATAWFLSILFGVLSALRENAFQTTTIVNDRDDLEIITSNNNGQHDESYYDNDQIIRTTIAGVLYNNNNNNSQSTAPIQANDLYNMIFSCVYFIFIILLPFGFVCGMYWRIFSEARENGLRVRQNGSSPLLQSALNLSSASSTHNNSVHNNIHHQHLVKDIGSSTATTGGLSMNIDRRRSSDRDVMKPLLFPIAVHRPSQQSNSSSDERHLPSSSLIKQDRNQNILLTLSAASEDVIRRNYSAKQLSSVLGSSDEDLIIETNTTTTTDDDRRITNKASIRHVHSTPNLQKSHDNNKFTNGVDGVGIGGGIGGRSGGIDYSHNALQLPTTIIQASPKALSYMTSIRHRLSNASSLFKYREESRAARISILVVIMFLISYLPYGLLVLLQSRLMNILGNSTQIAVLMVLMGHLSSPFIFAYRNKRVRRGVKRLFGLDQRSRDSSDFHRNCGGLLRTGTKANINVRRSASKASTNSINSCSKFLAPHAVNNGTTFLMDIEKCHYLNIKTTNSQKGAIIEQIYKDPDKRSILKIVCDSSRKLGCASNSCANSDNEQTDV